MPQGRKGEPHPGRVDDIAGRQAPEQASLEEVRLPSRSRVRQSGRGAERLLEREQQPKGRRRANAVADWGISWACAQPVADTQSGQRWYPRAALDLVDLPAENFVFEAAILIAASRERGMGVVSVPIASRYQGEFRISHFSPVRDVARITTYTVGQVLRHGDIMASYRRSRASQPIVFDTAVT